MEPSVVTYPKTLCMLLPFGHEKWWLTTAAKNENVGLTFVKTSESAEGGEGRLPGTTKWCQKEIEKSLLVLEATVNTSIHNKWFKLWVDAIRALVVCWLLQWDGTMLVYDFDFDPKLNDGCKEPHFVLSVYKLNKVLLLKISLSLAREKYKYIITTKQYHCSSEWANMFTSVFNSRFWIRWLISLPCLICS